MNDTDTDTATDSETQRKKAPMARYNAIKRLIAAHKDEFDELYADEAHKLGVRTRASSREAKIAKYEQKIRELKGE